MLCHLVRASLRRVVVPRSRDLGSQRLSHSSLCLLLAAHPTRCLITIVPQGKIITYGCSIAGGCRRLAGLVKEAEIGTSSTSHGWFATLDVRLGDRVGSMWLSIN